MSSYLCEVCGAEIIDTPRGYVTECEHHQLPPPAPKMTWRDYVEALADFYQEATDAQANDDTRAL